MGRAILVADLEFPDDDKKNPFDAALASLHTKLTAQEMAAIKNVYLVEDQASQDQILAAAVQP